MKNGGWSKSRIVLLFVVLVGLWTLLLLRASYLQFLPQARLKALQEKQFQGKVILESRRGNIFDREGRDLALSFTTFSLYADPKNVTAPNEAARRLAKVFGWSPKFLKAKWADKDKRFVWIQRYMSKEQMEKIKALELEGFSFVEEWKRVYPNDKLFASSLGFIGNEGKGLEGIELQYDETLKGTKKKWNFLRDARGRPLVNEDFAIAETPEGNDLWLTIDSDLQYQLEKELTDVVHEYQAESASGVILDAETSEIRAMGSFKEKEGLVRNRAITDAFEPGSTLKSFVIATALKKGLIAPNSKIFCEYGKMQIGKKFIRESDANHKFGYLTPPEILAFSSNIGAAKIGLRLGDEVLRQSLLDFGFGGKLGVDLPGEAKGILHETPWIDHTLANISFGQGIAVSPLQIANGYAALVNGGVLHRPYVVSRIKDAETGSVTEKKPEVIARVLSAEESEKMKIMLTSVTQEGGTGVSAKVNGFLVGGKTGTAQKVDPNGRGYLKEGYVSSFAGFIPVSQPKFVIYISVDEPKKVFYGGQVAAPVFSRMASYAVRKEGLAPMVISEKNLPRGADFASLPVHKKESALPMEDLESSKEWTRMPNFKHRALRDVLRELQTQGLQADIRGQGRVVATFPIEGEPLPADKKVVLRLETVR